MIICHCAAVTSLDIEKCCKQGCSTLEEISKVSGACTECKGCKKSVIKILNDNKNNIAKN